MFSSFIASIKPLVTNLEGPSSIPLGGKFLILMLQYFCSVAVGAWDMKFVILVEDPDSGSCFG